MADGKKKPPNKIGKNHLFNPRPIGKSTMERSVPLLFSLRRGLFQSHRARVLNSFPDFESPGSKRAANGDKTLDREREVVDRTEVNIRRPRLS